MASPNPIIGFVSGNSLGKNLLADAIGQEIAINGYIILTGGQPAGPTPKDAAMNGARNAGTAACPGKLIGILPGAGTGGSTGWQRSIQCSYHQLLIQTSLSNAERDLIIGATPDILIALDGKEGTLTEIAFALFCGVPIVLLNSAGKLQTNYNNPAVHSAFIGFLTRCQALYGSVCGKAINPAQLDASLGRFLVKPPVQNLAGGLGSNQLDAANAVAKAKALIKAVRRPTGFPGIPGSPESLSVFHDELLILDP